MKIEPIRTIILGMKPHSNTSKVLLVAHSRDGRAAGVATPIRRFRIARVRAENRPANIPGGLGSRTPGS